MTHELSPLINVLRRFYLLKARLIAVTKFDCRAACNVCSYQARYSAYGRRGDAASFVEYNAKGGQKKHAGYAYKRHSSLAARQQVLALLHTAIFAAVLRPNQPN